LLQFSSNNNNNNNNERQQQQQQQQQQQCELDCTAKNWLGHLNSGGQE
jgi:hypothetical protein